MGVRMKKHTWWTRIGTVQNQIRHMPASTLGKLGLLQASLGRAVSREMVMIFALEIGLSEIQARYASGLLSEADASRLFLKDFHELFGMVEMVEEEESKEGGEDE